MVHLAGTVSECDPLTVEIAERNLAATAQKCATGGA